MYYVCRAENYGQNMADWPMSGKMGRFAKIPGAGAWIVRKTLRRNVNDCTALCIGCVVELQMVGMEGIWPGRMNKQFVTTDSLLAVVHGESHLI